MKVTWLSTHVEGFHGNTTGAKKCLDDGKEMNTLILSSMSKASKTEEKY